MHRCLTVIAFTLVGSACRDRSAVEVPPSSVELPTMTIRAKSDEKSILIAMVSNPSSSELSIPGFDGDLIYGSYWYKDDKVINVPECGTGFWDSVIKIPAGETRELKLPVPRSVTRGDRYTVAVVYAGLGSSTAEKDRKKVSTEEWIRHPEIFTGGRKMETEVNLTVK